MPQPEFPAIRPTNNASVKEYAPVTQAMLKTLGFNRKYGALQFRRLAAYFYANRVKIIQPFIVFFLTEALGLRFVLTSVDWTGITNLTELLKAEVAMYNGYIPVWQLLVFVQLCCFGIIALTSFSVLIAWLRLCEVGRTISTCRAVPVQVRYAGDSDGLKVFQIKAESACPALTRLKKVGLNPRLIEGKVDQLDVEFPADKSVAGWLLLTDANTAYAVVTDNVALWLPTWHIEPTARTEMKVFD